MQTKLPVFTIFLLLTTQSVRAQAFDPATASLKLFNAYKPTIERRENAVVDNPAAIVGDLNGDGLVDCILYFVLTPKGGGNAVIDRQAAVYLNTGNSMKVNGAFPKLNYCFGVNKIIDGLIYVDSYECAPPYNSKLGTYTYRWKNGKLVTAR